MIYQPQQMGVVMEMMGAMRDNRITTPETQNILDASLSFMNSFIFMTALMALVRFVLVEALGEPKKEKVLPVIGAMMPETREKQRFLPAIGREWDVPWHLSPKPPKFVPAKRALRDRLYVINNHLYRPISGKWETFYTVESPKGYLRRGDFPTGGRRLGEYVPDEKDLFILDIHGFFSLEREDPIVGTQLQKEMERRGVFRAFHVIPA